jgi:XTP/dITP diphosphohydrolase
LLLVATRSRHKLEELRQLLDLPRTRLVSLDEVGVDEEAPEDAQTFEGNATFKARFYAERTGLPTLADDSGLEVDALGGGPGVRTRRYAGERATDEENNAKLLRELEGLPSDRRGARYRCVLVLVEPSGGAGTGARVAHELVARGSFEGRIATSARGTSGFGYDPVFEPGTEPPGGRTVGLYSAEEKHAVSHRGKAARAMHQLLVARGY